MYQITMKQLLEAGIHFGHQTKRWNPKMARYIFTKRNGIYVLDLQQTIKLLEVAFEYVRNLAAGGGVIIFVGPKKQAQEAIEEEASRCGMPYVNHRWLGGTLTNFKTIQKRIKYRNNLEKRLEEGKLEGLTKKEVQKLKTELERMNRLFYGLRNLEDIPDAIFIVDLKKERNAVLEAKKCEVPIVGLLDTNCDPDDVDYPIPANDDAIRAIKLLSKTIADAVMEGKEGHPVEEVVAEETTVLPEKAAEKPSAATEPASRPDVNAGESGLGSETTA